MPAPPAQMPTTSVCWRPGKLGYSGLRDVGTIMAAPTACTARADQHAERRGERGGGCEGGDTAEEHLLASVLVSQAPGRDQHGREHDRVGRQHP